MKMKFSCRAQSIAELSIVISIVISTIVIMGTYLRGSIQKSYQGAATYFINEVNAAKGNAMIDPYLDLSRERSYYKTQSPSIGVKIYTNYTGLGATKVYSTRNTVTTTVLEGWSQAADREGNFDAAP